MPEFEIQLRDVMVYARLGVMDEERVLGNQYRVNVRLHIDAQSFVEDDLASTVSYAEVFDLLEKTLASDAALLETVAVRFANESSRRWPLIKHGEIEIVKVVPPIPGMIGEAGVKYIF